MSISDYPIEKLTLVEKLALMERLWADLSSRPDEVAPPEWHGDVLDKRREAIRKGEMKLVPWEEAKARLKQRHQ